MLEHIKNHPAIIGYQIDNETRSYGTSGPNVQAQFVAYMKARYPSLDSLNKIFGLDYWSNRINNWDDFPSVNGSINASLNAEFAKFQRSLVTDYLAWQAAIVRDYKKPEQFITQNFDFDWRGHSYGIQTEVDHFAAAKVLDIAGVDIYHPSQDKLTGAEISFGGDVARSMKGGQNYLVMETEARASLNGCLIPVSCGYRLSATWLRGPIWFRTGIGIRYIIRQKLTGKACSATILNPTQLMKKLKPLAPILKNSRRIWLT
jgi:beta-galactosidase